MRHLPGVDHLAASKALDVIVGADRLTPTAEKMRRLMHYGQILQSHALHFFLSSPDLLFADSEVAQRNIVGKIPRHRQERHLAAQVRPGGDPPHRRQRVRGTGSIGRRQQVMTAPSARTAQDAYQMIWAATR